MERSSFNEVIVYHDETKRASGRKIRGHILLFVPIRLVSVIETPLFGIDAIEYFPHRELIQKIMEIRQESSCTNKFHFSNIGGKKWTKDDCARRRAVEIGVDSLRCKYPRIFPQPLSCKLAVMFYGNLADWSIYGGKSRKEKRLRHDETILRMLLKGAAHYLYDENNKIIVADVVSDGEPEHRHLDEERIVWRLTYDSIYGRAPLRDYVSFSPEASIIHLPSDHSKYEQDSEKYTHANLLQMTDLLLGSVIRSCYVGIAENVPLPRIGDQCVKKDVIAKPVKEMLDKTNRGAGFRNSGHYKSFTISQVEFSKDTINFREVKPIRVAIKDSAALQMQFFFPQGGKA